jgi:hypothetical protein
MGKAIIKSHVGNGLYDVDIIFDNAAIDAKKSAANARIAQLTTELETLEAQRQQIRLELSLLLMILDDAIRRL